MRGDSESTFLDATAIRLIFSSGCGISGDSTTLQLWPFSFPLLLLFSDIPCTLLFWGAFSFHCLRILGVPRREKTLAFFGVSLFLFLRKKH